MLTIIGDVHGQNVGYYELTKKHEYTLQLGDFGFNYNFLKQYVNPERHKFFGGNHDNYDTIASVPHSLGDFGQVTHGAINFFYVRGGYSIDLHYRHLGVSWWAEEELPSCAWKAVRKLYGATKPDLVITHECPRSVISHFSTWPDSAIIRQFGCKLPSKTSVELDKLLKIHRPKHWVFGHYHKNKLMTAGGTTFQCLDELSTVTIDD